MPHKKRADLLQAATAFCDAFAAQRPLDEILDHFCSDGHEEETEAEAEAYFEIIAECLRYDEMRFGDYVVDAAANRVAAKGRAVFT
ncbi:hypothetical protein GGR56DRAFT_672152 [Xylariaceae sp. FL0804]|nr:hypothetical protein GGR56DRAFT_672152 [Xylariaceae sp. FL0804]